MISLKILIRINTYAGSGGGGFRGGGDEKVIDGIIVGTIYGTSSSEGVLLLTAMLLLSICWASFLKSMPKICTDGNDCIKFIAKW